MNIRYLTSFDTKKCKHHKADLLVIGSGIAGMSAALKAASMGKSVCLLAKDDVTQTATFLAQGGIAVVLGVNDSVESHISDTLTAGSGLVDEDIARLITSEGQARVREIISWGANFDKTQGGELAMTREGAHSENRILHANGDSTGMEIIRALFERVKSNPNIQRLDGLFVVDLLRQGGAPESSSSTAVVGALVMGDNEELEVIQAGATVLATGGAGRLYRETTNPRGATGDGLGIAYRAGAVLSDLEFVQFHPTALYLAGVKRMLISEAVRGEGAHLLNTKRERFMPLYHPQAELAPRDVVSVAITEEMQKTNSPHVYLDLRPIGRERTLMRFPQIAKKCATYGLDITTDLVPVRPAAHYMMGGVKTDLESRTNIAGLFAAGEVGSSGLHGANRLASNSLLEGLVLGHKAGEMASQYCETTEVEFEHQRYERDVKVSDIEIDIDDVRRSLATLMDHALGVFRDARGLASAERTLLHWQEYIMATSFNSRCGLELQNMLSIATLITKAATERTESRGAHRRKDYPEVDDVNWKRHITHVID